MLDFDEYGGDDGVNYSRLFQISRTLAIIPEAVFCNPGIIRSNCQGVESCDPSGHLNPFFFFF